MIIEDKLRSIKGLILDADGVWFSGHEYRGVVDGKKFILKKRHFHDGQGLSFLRALGLKVVFATGEGEPLSSIVEKINNLPSVKNGSWAPVELFTKTISKEEGKLVLLETWREKHDLKWEECAYLGDDRSDLEPMQKAGLKIAPSNARRFIMKIADIQLKFAGGDGAVREFAEMVLDARGVSETDLPVA